MNHALCAVQINLVNAGYTAGPGEVTQLSVASPALATTASLNVQTGQLSSFAGQGDAITVDKTITLTGESQGTKIIAIPTGAQDNLTVKVVVDGATSTIPVTLNQPFVQGKAYVVNLKVKDAKTPVELVSVTVKEWTEEQLGDFDAKPVPPDNKYIIKIERQLNRDIFASNVIGFTGVIDWGDGSEPTSHSGDNNPRHTYKEPGVYTVTHTGKCNGLDADDNSYGLPDFSNCLTDVIHIGKDLGITNMSYAFYNCDKLISIREGLFDNLKMVKAFDSTFKYCSKLKSIPKGLFNNCTEVTTFDFAFSDCDELDKIPQGLFNNCTKVTNFEYTFAGCAITEIPSGLFDFCTNVKTFWGTFFKCESLLKVTEGLFDKCPDVENFSGVFGSCFSLTDVPVDLFDNCRKVTEFNSSFYACKVLSGESPYTLIDGVKVHLYERNNHPDHFARVSGGYCFIMCYKLSDFNKIPSNWKN